MRKRFPIKEIIPYHSRPISSRIFVLRMEDLRKIYRICNFNSRKLSFASQSYAILWNWEIPLTWNITVSAIYVSRLAKQWMHHADFQLRWINLIKMINLNYSINRTYNMRFRINRSIFFLIFIVKFIFTS